MILLKLPLPQIIAHPSTYIKTTEYKKAVKPCWNYRLENQYYTDWMNVIKPLIIFSIFLSEAGKSIA